MFRVKFLIVFFTALIWQVSNAQSYYDVFRTNIESPRQYSHHQNTINNWADQLRDPEFKDAVHYDINTHQTYQNEKHDESDIEESNYMQMNNTVHATMKQDSLEESNYSSHSNINQLSEMIKLNESESRMHTYHLPHSSGRGEILVHRPAPIILKRPSTRILINHPPLVVKPAPIVFHRPPPIIMRPIIVSSLPRRVQVQPMYVKVVKPKKKVMIKEKENTPCDCEEDNNIQENEYYNEKQRTLNDYQ